MDEYEIPRQNMVARLRDHYRIQNKDVLEVMNRLPRHLFVPEALKFQAYRDNALPIAGNQTISQPYIVARMTELLELDESKKVLEIGSGSGYQTAVLASLAGRVYSIERVGSLAESASELIAGMGFRNVTIKSGDGTVGWPAYSPYDGIMVTAGGPDVPHPLLDQLAPHGKLVIPIGEDGKTQTLTRFINTEDGIVSENHGKCTFVPLIGEHGWREPEERDVS